MAGLKLSGLLSGFDWQSVVDQLMTIQATPVTRMENEQARNSQKASALTTLDTKLTALQTSSNALKDTSLYSKRTASSSVSGSTWSATAADATVASSYKIDVTQLATAALWNGGSNIGKTLDSTGTYPNASVTTLMSSLPTGVPVTAGSFTVNGKRIDVSLTDSLDTVLGNIETATGGTVTANYNETTDKIELRSSSAIVLGSGADSSNFLQAMRLANNGTQSIDSSSNLGTATASATLENARLNVPFSGQDTDGSGTFKINGASIDYNTKTDSLNSIISKINSSSAGVVAAYDSVNDRVVLSNKSTGDVGFSVEDVKGNLMGALKLSNSTGTLVAGKNALFSINDGGTLTSMSNTLDASAHGIAGLTVSVNSESKEIITVASDSAAAKSAINDFISKYNDVQSYIDTQTKITTTGSKVTTSVLSSNQEVVRWGSTLRSLAFGTLNSVSGTIKNLDSLGIGFTSDSSTLQITNSTKLDAALKTSTSDVAEFFSNSTSGFAKTLNTFFTSTVGNEYGTKGNLDRQIDSLTKANTSLDEQIAALESQLEQKRAILEASFQAMETAQSKTSSALAQLSKISSSS